MKKVLINNQESGKICDVVEVGQEFEVHPDFSWVECQNDAVTRDWIYEMNADGVMTFKEFNPGEFEIDPTVASESFMIARQIGYGTVGEQLDMIYKEIQAKGSVGVDGEWFQHITAVKENIPKK